MQSHHRRSRWGNTNKVRSESEPALVLHWCLVNALEPAHGLRLTLAYLVCSCTIYEPECMYRTQARHMPTQRTLVTCEEDRHRSQRTRVVLAHVPAQIRVGSRQRNRVAWKVAAFCDESDLIKIHEIVPGRSMPTCGPVSGSPQCVTSACSAIISTSPTGMQVLCSAYEFKGAKSKVGCHIVALIGEYGNECVKEGITRRPYTGIGNLRVVSIDLMISRSYFVPRLRQRHQMQRKPLRRGSRCRIQGR